ncbi:FumA C-terminus/TtdB family hydratase beta subunit [Pumilibacter muris]|uniref:FumA C-terminus/TtdB family hydratase beta subunit n=1 Tax=Pumilibacter muris TaxID=2941510 RepID=UPI00203C304F|nr:FumA C-terminus/TtdB family hydratase beta subunit [Pumilibacter muris]
MKHYDLPLSPESAAELRCGDIVEISGFVLTARDAAHKKICEALKNGEPLPFDLSGAAIYYCGPTPACNGEIIGSCGPTTSSRMDDYAPALMEAGVKVMLGKGKRSPEVNDAVKKHGAIYFAAIGGAGALYKHKIKSCELVAYPELGCEAVRKLYIENVELLVATDSYGNTCLK